MERQWAQYIEKAWAQREKLLPGEIKEKIGREIGRCEKEEGELLKYVAATLPISDLGDYEPGLFLKFVRHGLRVREKFSRCKSLPFYMFVRDVMYPRINTEELADCRELFCRELTPIVEGLALGEAILQVNRWCARQATYRTTDDRTASPLAVYKCGYGRCGEESTFTVTALRSVGIAARQVYAPRWSHCDDNHAWVEAYDGEKWRFLGACEPEPVLDRGWFTSAATRAMMVHARTFFSGTKEQALELFPDVEAIDMEISEGVAYQTVTRRYAECVPVKIEVKDNAGGKAAGAKVEFSILNMGEFYPISEKTADGDGKTELYLGKGSVKISARKDGKTAEMTVNTEKSREITLALGEKRVFSPGGELDFFAPKDTPMNKSSLTAEQGKERRKCLEECAAQRERKAAARGGETAPQYERILALVTEKDRAGGVSKEVLEESLLAEKWEKELPREVFLEGVLSPRIGLEPLAPWRRELGEAFSQKEQEEYRKDPQKLWAWVEKEISTACCYGDLPATPAGIFRVKTATEQGKKVLFCAMCRAMGIGAWICEKDGAVEVWQEGSRRKVGAAHEPGYITITAPKEQGGLFRQNYTISRLTEKGEETIITDDIEAGSSRKIELTPGEYRLITVSRMPNGNQLAWGEDISLKSGEAREIGLKFRRGNIEDMLESCELTDFTMRDERGSTTPGKEVLKGKPLSLLCWAEVNREPTEHILNELREAAGKLKERKELCGVEFILESPEDISDRTLKKTLENLPQGRAWPCGDRGDFEDTVNALARRMYVDPDRLPLVILANSRGEGLYACSGYNVGTAELVLRMIDQITESGIKG